MKHLARRVGVAILAGLMIASMLGLSGCPRDIPPASDTNITGYEIRGRVVDRLANPVPFIEVRLRYNFDFIDSSPAPSSSYTVTDSTALIGVTVSTFAGQLVKTLYSGHRPVGPFAVLWDTTDANGRLVSSNVYRVNYLSNGMTQYSYLIAVDGMKVSATDASGEYIVGGSQLPIGLYPVPLYENGEYQGEYEVDPFVELDFVTSSVIIRRDVQVAKDAVTEFNLTLQ